LLWWLLPAPTEPTDVGAGTVDDLRTRDDDGKAAPHATAQPAFTTPSRATAPRPVERFDPAKQHLADTCTSLLEPDVPSDYESQTANGVTIAWTTSKRPRTSAWDKRIRPVELAYLVGGILEDAAAFTGTARRSELTVVVYPSKEEFEELTHAPTWMGGFYDGGAIRLYLAIDDLGVSLATLRHEVLHAQMHAGVGCVPFWFNEGLAMYFADTVPLRQWLRLLKSGSSFDVGSTARPVVKDMPSDGVGQLYAISLAMIRYIIDHGGEAALRHALQRAAGASSQKQALALWDELYPEVTLGTVMDSLAQRVFGAPRGSELDDILGGAMCCKSLGTPGAVTCHATASRPDKPYSAGSDKKTEVPWSNAERELCRNAW
jgi:hypothetical protein